MTLKNPNPTMIKPYYKALRGHLTDTLPELQTIALYNGQYDFSELELPLLCPAVYIEFSSLPWITGGLHTQESDAEIRLHLVMDYLLQSRADEAPWATEQYDLQVLDRVEALDKAMQGWQAVVDEHTYSTELLRTTTEVDTAADGLQVWVMSYRCRLIDGELNRDRNLTEYLLPGVRVNT